MIRKLLKECIEEAKEEYFKNDHHYYAGEIGKDEAWKEVFNEEPADIFFEYILPVIKYRCPDLWLICDTIQVGDFCLNLVNGER